mgnify:FL=1|tara:strand:- start:6249 stop:6989 length:741 start_codon:yes stop_codon:yes gene_type:complete
MNKTIQGFALTSAVLALPAHAQLEPEMLLVPAACVELGSLLLDQQNNPLREECLEPFYIGKYEITFAQFDEFTRATGLAPRNDLGIGRDTLPVIDVSWDDAVAFAKWLSQKTGETYRLPTDAEWEYAARAGAEFGFKYHWGPEALENQANCRDCGSQWDGNMAAPVGSFAANNFGLHDMHGNVWEWTADCGVVSSPSEAGDSGCRVGTVRGGSWDVPAAQIAFTFRAQQQRRRPTRDTGFRLVREQ